MRVFVCRRRCISERRRCNHKDQRCYQIPHPCPASKVAIRRTKPRNAASVVLVGVTDVEADWHRGVAYVAMSRAGRRLHVIIHEDCDGKRREGEGKWPASGEGDVQMLL